MRAGLRPRWIVLLTVLSVLVAGVLTAWLEGVAAAQTMTEASEMPPCESPAMGCIDRTVCIAKGQQAAILAAAPAALVGVEVAGPYPAPQSGAALLSFGPQPPPPRA